jgi:hypothetical protein
MSDLLSGRASLDSFRGIIFVGGFSYADVLDSAKGWAGERAGALAAGVGGARGTSWACRPSRCTSCRPNTHSTTDPPTHPPRPVPPPGTIRFNERVLKQFQDFYNRPDTFSLGICNGCQLQALLGWVPATGDAAGGVAAQLPDAAQPRFVHNKSGRCAPGAGGGGRREIGAARLLRRLQRRACAWCAPASGLFQASRSPALAHRRAAPSHTPARQVRVPLGAGLHRQGHPQPVAAGHGRGLHWRVVRARRGAGAVPGPRGGEARAGFRPGADPVRAGGGGGGGGWGRHLEGSGGGTWQGEARARGADACTWGSCGGGVFF